MKKPWIIPQYEEPIPEDYQETGLEHGAKIEEFRAANPDIVRILEATKPLGLKDALKWIDEHEQSFDDSTVILDTDDGKAFKSLRRLHPEVLVNKRPLNKIQHLNTFLNCANEVLENGGFLWCHARTSHLKEIQIQHKYGKIRGGIVFLQYYFWHRFCAKVRPFRWLYMKITHGQNRTYSRVELLGRMYRAGFEVVDEELRHGEFFVLGRKFRAPIWDDDPTCGIFVKLNRVGKDGKIIGVYKFRTMYAYSEYLQPYMLKHEGLQDGGKFANDYRVNFWGRKLRAVWLDEFPMFINLLKRQLKLVGVRPLSRHYFSLYTPEMQQLRIKVKPGLIPPFYYEKETPHTIQDVQESERRYIMQYLEHPWKTDWKYFWGIVGNILFKHKRSH